MGFPVGYKEKLLLGCLQRYDYRMPEPSELPAQGFDLREAGMDVPDVAEEIEMEACQQEPIFDSEVDNMEDEKDCDEMFWKENRVGVPGLNFQSFEYKNGSIFQNYCWSQTLSELELYVLLPPNVNSRKDIDLMMRPSSITVKVEDRILLSGEVWSKYKYNNVIWTLVDGKLQISIGNYNKRHHLNSIP